MSAELLDWFNVGDTYCVGLAEIENLPGGNVRLSWYTARKMGGEEPVRVLVACLVMAAETAADAGQGMMQCAAPAEKERSPAINARSTLN
jgi:hypothetical protein